MDGQLLTLKFYANNWDIRPRVTNSRIKMLHLLLVLCSLTDVSYSLSGHTKRLSAPIHMDNVACFGSEDKLIECTYHTDTSEDDHSADVRVHCKPSTNAMQSSTYAISVVALTLVLIVISLIAVIGSVCIVVRHRKERKHTSNTER